MNASPFHQQLCLMLTDNAERPSFIGAAHPDVHADTRRGSGSPKMDHNFISRSEYVDVCRAVIIGENHYLKPILSENRGHAVNIIEALRFVN
jgi:hypothetical protein